MFKLTSDEQDILGTLDYSEAKQLYELWKFNTDMSTLRNKCVNLKLVMHLNNLERQQSAKNYPSLF